MLIFVEILLTDPLENADRKDCKDRKGLQAMVNDDPGVRERRERRDSNFQTEHILTFIMRSPNASIPFSLL